MYNLYVVSPSDGVCIIAGSNLTLNEVLSRAEDILAERAFTEVIISEEPDDG